MSSLTLRLRSAVSEHLADSQLNLNGLTPDRVLELPRSEIAELPIACEHRQLRLADCFEIREEGRQQLVLAGDLKRSAYVGGEMRSGVLRVESCVGHRLANNMRGGKVTVLGSAGEFACSTLHGGTVDVHGDVGDSAAGIDLARGPMSTGMRGGRLIVRGKAGRWLANRMRRGTVIVHGNCAAAAATRMIAGTLVLCGRVEQPLGAGMQRGTVLLLASEWSQGEDDGEIRQNIPGFPFVERAEMSWLPILLRDLQSDIPSLQSPDSNTRIAMRCTGDRSVAGQGELLWLVDG